MRTDSKPNSTTSAFTIRYPWLQMLVGSVGLLILQFFILWYCVFVFDWPVALAGASAASYVGSLMAYRIYLTLSQMVVEISIDEFSLRCKRVQGELFQIQRGDILDVRRRKPRWPVGDTYIVITSTMSEPCWIPASMPGLSDLLKAIGVSEPLSIT